MLLGEGMPDWPFKCLKGNICAEGGFPALTIWWHQLGRLMLTEEESSYISITHPRWRVGVGGVTDVGYHLSAGRAGPLHKSKQVRKTINYIC